MADPRVRKEYSPKSALLRSADPYELFSSWYTDAANAGFSEPNTMALATATKSGVPSVRMVLLKGFDAGGFVFFTNYESRKARELTENPNGAVAFYWDKLERQVRAVGKVTKVSRIESEEYFRTRPRGAQIAAALSRQSSVLADPTKFIAEWTKQDGENKNEIPCPANWGGYRLEPVEIEFWLGTPNRLHERLQFLRSPQGEWQSQRLYP